MKIIVDMMGGDNAPLAVLEGAAAAVKEYGVQLIGVGDEALVRKTAADNNISLDGIELVNCTEVIEMCDEPARAIRTKKDSSIVVGLNMLKEGKGDAFVSAGSTGALHVGASLIVRTLRGIKRPALATMVPAQNKAYLLLKDSVSDLKHQMDSEEYGGAPFLGAKQPVIKAHGSSKAKGIKNAIRQAKICVENDLCGTMQAALDELNTTKE